MDGTPTKFISRLISPDFHNHTKCFFSLSPPSPTFLSIYFHSTLGVSPYDLTHQTNCMIEMAIVPWRITPTSHWISGKASHWKYCTFLFSLILWWKIFQTSYQLTSKSQYLLLRPDSRDIHEENKTWEI